MTTVYIELPFEAEPTEWHEGYCIDFTLHLGDLEINPMALPEKEREEICEELTKAERERNEREYNERDWPQFK